jgi:hypothetical protein
MRPGEYGRYRRYGESVGRTQESGEGSRRSQEIAVSFSLGARPRRQQGWNAGSTGFAGEAVGSKET